MGQGRETEIEESFRQMTRDVTLEMEGVRRDGSVYWMSLHVAPILGSDSQVVHLASSYHHTMSTWSHHLRARGDKMTEGETALPIWSPVRHHTQETDRAGAHPIEIHGTRGHTSQERILSQRFSRDQVTYLFFLFHLIF